MNHSVDNTLSFNTKINDLPYHIYIISKLILITITIFLIGIVIVLFY